MNTAAYTPQSEAPDSEQSSYANRLVGVWSLVDIPDGVVHVQTHEPTEQQVIVELFHQQPLAAHRVQRLQQERSQQLLRRDRRPPGFRIQLEESWLQFS